MAIGRLVPWSSWEQWGAVYRDLFAGSVSQKNTALYQVLYHSNSTATDVHAPCMSFDCSQLHVHAVSSLAVPRQGPVGC